LFPADGQRPPPPVRRHPRHPEPSRDPRSLAPTSINSAAASRTRPGEPSPARSTRRHPGTSWFRHSARCAAVTRAHNPPQLKIFSCWVCGRSGLAGVLAHRQRMSRSPCR
jgi:hypothetical protein